MSSTLAACSGVFCGGGALLNLALQRHSARNPDSWINRKVCINNNINDQQPVRSFLVTLTAQCPEARYAELGPTYKEVLDSFKFK